MTTPQEVLKKERKKKSKERQEGYYDKNSDLFLDEKDKFIQIFNKLKEININHSFLKKYNLKKLTKENCKIFTKMISLVYGKELRKK